MYIFTLTFYIWTTSPLSCCSLHSLKASLFRTMPWSLLPLPCWKVPIGPGPGSSIKIFWMTLQWSQRLQRFSPTILGKIHLKTLVRGEVISQGAKLKKAHQADFQLVLCALQQAELWHRGHGDPEVLKTLTELFARLLDRHVSRHQRYLSHKFYEQGNKCGRMLARALRKRHTQDHIHKLWSPAGDMVAPCA